MKFDCGLSRDEKIKNKKKWRRWFAWHPVRIDNHDCRWLEYVERKGVFWTCFSGEGWDYEYRLPEKEAGE